MLRNRFAARHIVLKSVATVLLTMPFLAISADPADGQDAPSALPIFGLQFSPDGKFLAATGSSGDSPVPIVLWNVSDWSTATVVGRPTGCLDLDFSADGKFLAYACKNGSVGIIDAQTGEVVREIEAHEGAVYSVAFLPDRNSLISAGEDSKIHQWNVLSGERMGDFNGHTGTVCGVAVSPDGRTLVSGGDDKSVRVWDIASRKESKIFPPCDNIVRRVSFTKDGAYFLASSWDGKVRVRDTSTYAQRVRLDSGSNCADATDNNQLVATTSYSPIVRVYSVQLREPTEEEREEIASCLAAFTHESYDEREQAAKRILELGMVAEPQLREALTTEDAEVRVRARTLRNKVLSPQSIAELPGHSGDTEVVDFSPDGTCLATGCRGGDVKIWDVATFQELYTFRLPSAIARSDK